MFSSSWSLGFNLSDVTGQIENFLANTVVTGLIAAGLALAFIPRIIKVVRGTIGGGGSRH